MAVTAHIESEEAGGSAQGGMTWFIEYDDSTRNVTAQADGQGHCLVTVHLTATQDRTVAFVQPGQSATADSVIVVGTGTQVIASNIPPAQVRRVVGKTGATGGLPFESEWSRV